MVDSCIFSANQDFQQLQLEDEELFKVRNFGWLNVSVKSKPDQPPGQTPGNFFERANSLPLGTKKVRNPDPWGRKIVLKSHPQSNYSKNPRIRTSTFKNLQPKIWGL